MVNKLTPSENFCNRCRATKFFYRIINFADLVIFCVLRDLILAIKRYCFFFLVAK